MSAAPRALDVSLRPPGGTLPNRKRACAKLSNLPPGAFAQVPKDAICTQIYGGPQKAVVKGTVGDAIWASFRRRNGCEIARWARFSPWLLPPGGVTDSQPPAGATPRLLPVSRYRGKASLCVAGSCRVCDR